MALEGGVGGPTGGGLTPKTRPGTPRSVAIRGNQRRAMALGVALALGGCAPTITAEDQEISMRQVDLANSLRLEGNAPAALERLEVALRHDPDNPDAHLLLAFIHASRQDYPTAERSARRGVQILVVRQIGGARLAEARNLLGGILMNLGRHDEAVEVLRAAAVDPYNQAPHLAWYNLAMAESAAGRPDEALTALTESVRLRANFCDGFYGMGQLLYQQERLAESEAALSRALVADPTCASSPAMQGAYRLRGEVRTRLGRSGEATADFERCIELGPESEEGVRCQAVLDGAPASAG